MLHLVPSWQSEERHRKLKIMMQDRPVCFPSFSLRFSALVSESDGRKPIFGTVVVCEDVAVNKKILFAHFALAVGPAWRVLVFNEAKFHPKLHGTFDGKVNVLAHVLAIQTRAKTNFARTWRNPEEFDGVLVIIRTARFSGHQKARQDIVAPAGARVEHEQGEVAWRHAAHRNRGLHAQPMQAVFFPGFQNGFIACHSIRIFVQFVQKTAHPRCTVVGSTEIESRNFSIECQW